VQRPRAAEAHFQLLVSVQLFFGSFFVRARFSLRCNGLSDRMYKICTLSSTGFVDNGRWRVKATSRKALLGAAFRGAARVL
jgi:hypothetical protein